MTQSIPEIFRRKINTFRKDPAGSFKRKLEESFPELLLWYRETYGFRFSRPFYDVSRYFLNREARQLHGIEEVRMAPNSVQRQVINDLKSKGISVIQFDDLFPSQELSELQELAEIHLKRSPNREIIEAMEGGAKRATPTGKFYVLTLLGETPVLDLTDRFIQISLSHELLGIASGYLQMLPRLTYVNLWYNMPTPGPDIQSQRWHRDSEDRRLVKVFLYLRDVNEHHGPFCYRPETQKGGRFGNVHKQNINRYNYPPGDALEKRLPSVPQVCTGKAGTMIICDTAGFHKGGHVAKDGRLVFVALYTTNASTPVVTRKRFYSISDFRSAALSPAAEYALGHLEKPSD